MDRAYQPTARQPLWTTVAGSSAALLGLLIVGLSVDVRAVAGEPSHRARAREALGLLLVLVVLSILSLLPGRSTAVLTSLCRSVINARTLVVSAAVD